ncbi:MAG: DNA repair protein RecO C-terminal domain-containing protein, partial [Verrucomicrobia bacterium]|nr:DNA repair protein RecO C-terminal domain-containing protein [Verrucomicrobiota bacterium]
LEQMGLAPRLRRCAACGAALASGPRRTEFAVARGGLLCPDCAGEDRENRARVGSDVLGMLAAWQQARAPQGPLNTRCTSRQRAAIETLLGGFLAYHLDVQPAGRRAALDVLARRVA